MAQSGAERPERPFRSLILAREISTVHSRLLPDDMDTSRFRTYRVIAFDLLLMLFCVSNIPSVIDRARLPITSRLQASRTVISDVESHPGVAQLRPGDILVAWNDIRIVRPEHVEFLGDRSRIGETVAITVERDGSLLSVPASLVSFSDSLRFALIYTITGLFVLTLASFLVLKRPSDPAAMSLHRALAALGALLFLTQGALTVDDPLSYGRRAGLFTAYALTGAFFLSWTLDFPVRRFSGRRWPHVLVNGSALLFALVLSWFHLRAMVDGSPELFDLFQDVYELFHLYFPLLIAAGLVVLSAGYAGETDPDRRQALRWILWGMLVGTAPFTLLVVLPQGFGPEFYVPEEIGTVFALAIPVSLTVAFLRYHVFEVQVGVHRRFASRVLYMMTGSLSVLASLVFVSIFWEGLVFDDHMAPAIAIAVVTLLLQPARAGLRRLFEESLLPVRGALAQVLQRLEERLQNAMSPDQLATTLIHELTLAIPGLEFWWARVERDGRLVVRRHLFQESVIVDLPPEVRAALRPRSIVAQRGLVAHPSDMTGSSVLDWMTQRSAEVAWGLHDESGSLLGIVLGRRESRREPLAAEEIQAIRAMAAQAAGSLARLHLQEVVFLEQQERRRSDELNRLKSRFVSSVSHDLRTPLTSIKMFAEMLQDPRLPSDRRQEYAEIIARESQRLGRMVNNVLDFARIERGAREYVLESMDLRPVLEAAIEAMRGHAESLDGTLTLRAPKRLPQIRGDADALQDVLHNLIGNGLKYSRGRRRVVVEAEAQPGHVLIRVKDNGIGIAAEHLPSLFDPFYRVKDDRAAQIGGVGLGLSIVKHTIDAHAGTVTIDSTVGKGTTVSIQLPVGGT